MTKGRLMDEWLNLVDEWQDKRVHNCEAMEIFKGSRSNAKRFYISSCCQLVGSFFFDCIHFCHLVSHGFVGNLTN
jgi:hypothetical protein